MDPSAGLTQGVTKGRRQRDVHRLYGAAFRNIPYLDRFGPDDSLPSEHVPQPSSDSLLTALAQFAACRLNAGRCLISLIDSERQYILAEATPQLSLRYATKGLSSVPNHLWLGHGEVFSIPRSWSLCERVLDIDPTKLDSIENACVIIDDLADIEAPKAVPERTYVRDGPRIRSFAGVALFGSKGTVIGSLSIYDDKPRAGLPKDDILFLQDLAAIIVEHLDHYTLKQQYRRGEQLTRGLVSFSEGAIALQPFRDETTETATQNSPPLARKTSQEPTLSHISHDLLEPMPSPNSLAEDIATPSAKQPPQSAPSLLAVDDPVKAWQDSILPANTKTMFARAANVILESSELDGVLFLDASIAVAGQTYQADDDGIGSGGETVSYESTHSRSSSDDENSKPAQSYSMSQNSHAAGERSSQSSSRRCQVLGFATPDECSIQGHKPPLTLRSFLETNLTILFQKYPKGKILHFTAPGEVVSSSAGESDSTRSGDDQKIPKQEGRHSKTSDRSATIAEALHALLPDAKSVTFVPLWDFERSRWFAGGFYWSNSSERLLSTRLDLAYFKVFSNVVMTELARLDAIASNQAKASFVASISHELRSPLHGILGNLQFLQESPLDSFQIAMLGSMAACGRTLLDTLNHVLDYAKLPEVKRNASTIRLKDTKTILLSSKPLRNRQLGYSHSQEVAFDLAQATEEVVEAVFAGQAYGVFSDAFKEGLKDSSDATPDKRKDCFIVLNIAQEDDWDFVVPPGSWRRIVMNIFGNALKYTDSGQISISLRASERRNDVNTPRNIVLTITDSGSGMSPQFLANKVFQPFSQENPHATGTGLGLSIVRQMIESIGGKVEINSDTDWGTKTTVKLPLARTERGKAKSPEWSRFSAALPRLMGRRICLLRTEYPPNATTLNRFADNLASTLTDWLKMEVVQTSEWEGHDADFVICPEPSFDYLTTIRRQRATGTNAPVTIFIAMDALEASTLRSDARIVSKESVVEIMTQPCGPYKLMNVLSHCLDRYGSAEENLQPPIPSKSDVTSAQTPTIPLHASLITSSSDHSDSPVASETLPINISPPPKDENIISPATTLATITPVPTETAALTGSRDSALPYRARVDPRHILITDDNLINRKLLVAFMKKHKFQYGEVVNGLEALQAYQDGPVKYDVILMDISMPVMDGMEATRAIRNYERKNKTKRVHIIALTGLTSASARLEAWSAGVDHYMSKPINFKELEAVLTDERSEALQKQAVLLEERSEATKRQAVLVDEESELTQEQAVLMDEAGEASQKQAVLVGENSEATEKQ